MFQLTQVVIWSPLLDTVLVPMSTRSNSGQLQPLCSPLSLERAQTAQVRLCCWRGAVFPQPCTPVLTCRNRYVKLLPNDSQNITIFGSNPTDREHLFTDPQHHWWNLSVFLTRHHYDPKGTSWGSCIRFLIVCVCLLAQFAFHSWRPPRDN